MGRNPPTAGLNGTSPEIPYTVDADPYATAGKAPATARAGERGPASTGASAVGTQGREAHGTREILSSPRGRPVDPDPKGNRRGGHRPGEVGSAHTTAEARESLVEGRGRQTSVSPSRAWRALRGPAGHPLPRDGTGIEQTTLFRDETDRTDCVARRAALAAQGAWTVQAWPLLPNHAHRHFGVGN